MLQFTVYLIVYHFHVSSTWWWELQNIWKKRHLCGQLNYSISLMTDFQGPIHTTLQWFLKSLKNSKGTLTQEFPFPTPELFQVLDCALITFLKLSTACLYGKSGNLLKLQLNESFNMKWWNYTVYSFNILFFTMFHLKNNISHGSTNKMYTDTVVLISQLEVTSVLICNSVLITEHLATAFYGTLKITYLYYTQKGQ